MEGKKGQEYYLEYHYCNKGNNKINIGRLCTIHVYISRAYK
jgi:hypothetical protein